MRPRPLLHVGIDDTDSPKGGCTTYVASVLVEQLEKMDCRFIDYPVLLRLNPNVPWKTRGNGAVCLRFTLDTEMMVQIKEVILETVDREVNTKFKETEPAIAFFTGDIPERLSQFSLRTMRRIITVEEAKSLAAQLGVEILCLWGERGSVGAMAALGEVFTGDYTFELIAYRRPDFRGLKRRVDAASVMKMDEETQPSTYNNFDYERNRILITPHGPDPILYGVRGESPDVLLKTKELLKVEEPVERWCLFKTNQGTDMHLVQVDSLSNVHPYSPIEVEGRVLKKPYVFRGGHVFFSITDGESVLECAAYEPTGRFRDIVKMLQSGDGIRVAGGVRGSSHGHEGTLNLEKLEILELAEVTVNSNPRCSLCKKRMESAGRRQGFRCRKCGRMLPHKVKKKMDRTLKIGVYLPPPRANRHLTKPLIRYGNEKHGEPSCLVDTWHSP